MLVPLGVPRADLGGVTVEAALGGCVWVEACAASRRVDKGHGSLALAQTEGVFRVARSLWEI